MTRYPKYIHILKVNPKSASATIDNSALWALTEAKDDEGDEDPNEVPFLHSLPACTYVYHHTYASHDLFICHSRRCCDVSSDTICRPSPMQTTYGGTASARAMPGKAVCPQYCQRRSECRFVLMQDVMKELADVKAQLDDIKQLLKASAPNSTAETSTS